MIVKAQAVPWRFRRRGAGHRFRGDGYHLNPIGLDTVFLPLALQLAEERGATRVVSDSCLCSATEEGDRGGQGRGARSASCWRASPPLLRPLARCGGSAALVQSSAHAPSLEGPAFTSTFGACGGTGTSRRRTKSSCCAGIGVVF